MKSNLLIFLLIFTLCVPSLTFTAYAESAEFDETFETAVSLIHSVYQDYQMSDGSSVVSRGDFSMILAGVTGVQFPTDVDAGFSDVEPDSPFAPSVAFLVKTGVISPGTLFYPDAPIKYNQAMKMVVAAAGYTKQAETQGGYPVGYLSVGSSLNLDKNVQLAEGSLNFRDTSVLIYNLLHCRIMEQEPTDKGASFLSFYRNIYNTTGVVTGNEYSGLTDCNENVQKGNIKIGTTLFASDEASYNELLGYRVKVYYTSANGTDTVVFMHKYRCSEVTLSAPSVYDVKNFFVYSSDDGKERTYRLNRSYIYIMNGKQLHLTASDHTPYFTIDSGQFTLIDNDSDGAYDVVFAWDYKYSLISSVDAFHMTITDQNTSDSYLDLSSNDCTYKIYDYTGSKQLQLSDLGKDMLIAYAASADKKLYNIYLCDKSISGTLNSISTNTDEIYIDGSLYGTNSYFNSYYSDSAVGNASDFYLGMDGSVTVALTKSESDLRYGWIVACAKENGVKKGAKIKIFSQDESMVITKLNQKVTVNGAVLPSEQVEAMIASFSDDEKFVKYSVNQEGVLSRIITSKDVPTEVLPSAANESDTDFIKYISRTTEPLKYRASTSVFYSTESGSKSSFHVSPSTYNFIIPKTDRDIDDNYRVYSPDSFVDGISYNISAYDLDKSSLAGATICFDETSYDLNSVGTTIVEKVVTSLNEEGEVSLAVTGYNYGVRKYVSYYSCAKTNNDILNLHPGDLVRMTVNNKNVVTSVIRDFDSTTYALGSSVDSVGGSSEYICGLLYNYSNGYMSIFSNTAIAKGMPVLPSPFRRDQILSLCISTNSIMYVDLERSADGSSVRSALVRPSDISEIRSYTDVGSNADYVVSRRYQSGKSYTVVIYKIH